MRQLCKHPLLAWRTQPEKRASAMLRPYREQFEILVAQRGGMFFWRLSPKAKKELGLDFKSVSPCSSRIEHWLSVGDLWQALFHTGGKPHVFLAEPKHSAGFDVYVEWQGRAYLVEIQRTPLTTKAWTEKWDQRLDWYNARAFEQAPWYRGVVPRPVLILKTEQEDSTVGLPKGALAFKSADTFAKTVVFQKKQAK